jgi:hypothetical protein
MDETIECAHFEDGDEAFASATVSGTDHQGAACTLHARVCEACFGRLVARVLDKLPKDAHLAVRRSGDELVLHTIDGSEWIEQLAQKWEREALEVAGCAGGAGVDAEATISASALRIAASELRLAAKRAD